MLRSPADYDSLANPADLRTDGKPQKIRASATSDHPGRLPKFRGFKITAQRPGSSRVIAALFSVEIGLSFAERRKFAEEPSTAPDMDAS